MLQSEYRKRGFQEVVSPNIYNAKLWERSGHWQHYAVITLIHQLNFTQCAIINIGP